MSVRFSRVKLMSEKKAALFLVGGIPRSKEDLAGWLAFQDFCEEVEGNDLFTAFVETFEYGEGESFDASPEEVAYFYMRIDRRPDFIEARTRKTAESEFRFRLRK